MKKFLAVIALLSIISTSSFAAGGQFYAGGTLGYFVNSSNSSGATSSVGGLTTINTASSSEFSISPEIGFTINDKFDAGLRFSYSTKSTKLPYGNTTINTTGYGIAPYCRYVLADVGDFRFLAKFLISYDTAKDDFHGAKALDTIGLLLSPVVEYKVTKYFSLVATAGAIGLSFSSQGKVNSTTFGFNRGLGGELGVSFSFL